MELKYLMLATFLVCGASYGMEQKVSAGLAILKTGNTVHVGGNTDLPAQKFNPANIEQLKDRLNRTAYCCPTRQQQENFTNCAAATIVIGVIIAGSLSATTPSR